MKPSKITVKMAESQAKVLPPPSDSTMQTDREPSPENRRIVQLALVQALVRQRRAAS
jgi:hypothetical protein